MLQVALDHLCDLITEQTCALCLTVFRSRYYSFHQQQSTEKTAIFIKPLSLNEGFLKDLFLTVIYLKTDIVLSPKYCQTWLTAWV